MNIDEQITEVKLKLLDVYLSQDHLQVQGNQLQQAKGQLIQKLNELTQAKQQRSQSEATTYPTDSAMTGGKPATGDVK